MIRRNQEQQIMAIPTAHDVAQARIVISTVGTIRSRMIQSLATQGGEPVRSDEMMREYILERLSMQAPELTQLRSLIASMAPCKSWDEGTTEMELQLSKQQTMQQQQSQHQQQIQGQGETKALAARYNSGYSPSSGRYTSSGSSNGGGGGGGRENYGDRGYNSDNIRRRGRDRDSSEDRDHGGGQTTEHRHMLQLSERAV